MSLVTLVEVLLAAAIVFGIGVAATSALGGSEAVADEPPPALPPVEPAELTAEDVARVRLPLAARGYRMADVDAVLDQLEQAIAERDEELARLRGGARQDSGSGFEPAALEAESAPPLWADPVQREELSPKPAELPEQPYPDQVPSPPEQAPPEQVPPE